MSALPQNQVLRGQVVGAVGSDGVPRSLQSDSNGDLMVAGSNGALTSVNNGPISANVILPGVTGSNTWGTCYLWFLNSAGVAGNQLTGTMGVETSNDNVNFYLEPASISPVKVGPGNPIQSGSFETTTFAQYMRPRLFYTSGAGTSLTSSFFQKA